jgi:hypothetical protein
LDEQDLTHDEKWSCAKYLQNQTVTQNNQLIFIQFENFENQTTTIGWVVKKITSQNFAYLKVFEFLHNSENGLTERGANSRRLKEREKGLPVLWAGKLHSS